MIPRTPTKGRLCIVAKGPVNVGLGALQMSVARMKGKRATATLLLAFGQLQNSVAEARGCFLPDRSGPPAIWTRCRHLVDWSEPGHLLRSSPAPLGNNFTGERHCGSEVARRSTSCDMH